MTHVEDHVLAQIAVNGRAYWNEAKAMALELIERRAKDAATAAQLSKTQPLIMPGVPYP